jgi:4-amino-4-deoxy-L-arabinose transferase-like glycosyltransferase
MRQNRIKTPWPCISIAGRHMLIILVVAIGLRLPLFLNLYLIQGRDIALTCGGDPGAYMGMAQHVYLYGNVSDTLFLPRAFLFPALAGILYHVTGQSPLAIIFLNILINTLTCLAIYRLAQAVGLSSRLSLAAGLIAALYPAMISSSICYMTDALMAFFFALSLLLFARFLNRPNWLDLLLATATLDCANLTRSAMILLPFLLVLFVIWRTRMWRYALVFLFVAMLPLGLLTFRNWYYGHIPTFSTQGQWMLLFMRATSSERRATGDDPGVIYARYIQEIERRLGHEVPPLESIPTERIWKYLQPSPEEYAVISDMAIKENLRYPVWYVLNTFYGLYLILVKAPEVTLLPSLLSDVLHFGFVVLACLGGWGFWKHGRRWALLFGSVALATIGLTIALETAVVNTRHGLAGALVMFILAARGIEAVQPSVARFLRKVRAR